MMGIRLTFSLLFAPLLFMPSKSLAQQKPGMKPLSFYADKNNVQILAQRFEYALIDADQFQLSDILIDSTKLRMKLHPNPKENRILFNWPAALLSDGRISLLNNNGKALWTQDFTPKQVRIRKIKNADPDDTIRNEIAQFASSTLPKEVMEELKYLPFLHFCVSRITPETKIYVCSKDVFLYSGPNGVREFRPRSAAQKDAFVEIGGSIVSNQGLIYLNEAKDDLVLRAQTEVGANIEIITRKREIDFKDVILSDDGKQILITASGASPARKDNVTMVGKDAYQIKLSRARPYYYVLGEGGIPMRQEFLVRADPPMENLRVYIQSSAPTRTYRREVDLRGTKPAEVILSAEEPLGELKDLSNNQFEWTLKDQQAGIKNRRSLILEANKKEFVASYDIEGGRPNQFDGDLILGLNKGIAWGNLSYRRHIEDFLWIKSRATEFRWALSADYFKQLNTKEDTPEVDLMTVGLHWKATAGFPFEKSSFGMGLLMGPAKINKESSTAMGLELLYETPASKNWERWMHWWDTRTRIWSGSGNEAKLTTSWQLEARAYRKLGANSYWRTGAGASQFKTSSALSKEGPSLDLSIGAGLQF
jgi:hypothetical protein